MSDTVRREVHRVEVLIVDTDRVGADGARDLLEHARYPNHAIAPLVLSVETREVGWSDEHPLNHSATMESAARDLFAPEAAPLTDGALRWCERQGTATRAEVRSMSAELLTAREELRAERERLHGVRDRLVQASGVSASGWAEIVGWCEDAREALRAADALAEAVRADEDGDDGTGPSMAAFNALAAYRAARAR